MIKRQEYAFANAIGVALIGAAAGAIAARPALLGSVPARLPTTTATASTPERAAVVAPAYPAFRIDDALSR
jgi:hypothetical protein